MNINLAEEDRIKVILPTDLYPLMQKILLNTPPEDRMREHFWVVSLDLGMRILNVELIALGSVRSVVVEMLEVYSVPLQKKATRIILVHNHPSGNLLPSSNDVDLTDRIIQVGKLMGVLVYDHLIISNINYCSFLESGLLHQLYLSQKYAIGDPLRAKYEEAAYRDGINQGRKEREYEIICELIDNDVNIEIIADATGLDESTIIETR